MLLTPATLQVLAQEQRLSLQEAKVLALQNNRGMQIQRLEQNKATESVKEAKSLLLPRLTWNNDYTFFADKTVIFMPGAFTDTPDRSVVDLAVGGRHAFNSSLSFSQPVQVNGLRKQVKAASLTEELEEVKTTAKQSALLYDVSVQYLQALILQEQLRLQEQSLQRNLKALSDSRALYIQGRNYKADTLRNYISAENLRATVLYLNTQVELSKSSLKRLVGINTGTTIILSDEISAVEIDLMQVTDQKQALQTALEKRTDIRALKVNLLKSQNNLSLIHSEKSPKVWLTGQYQLQAQADDLRLGQYTWPATSFAGAHIAVPIFAGNRINYKQNQAKITMQQNTLAITELEQKVENELFSVFNSLKEAENRMAIQERTVEAAELGFQMAENRYKQGLGSRLELADAELALTQAKANQLQALYQVKVYQLELLKVMGLL
ncbi:MAG: TolC family protein [Pontibacter sp.]|nr:TolC family protein [Pontibacter sp.]